jgi:formate-dependent nitrite reductase membrane component NrfD
VLIGVLLYRPAWVREAAKWARSCRQQVGSRLQRVGSILGSGELGAGLLSLRTRTHRPWPSAVLSFLVSYWKSLDSAQVCLRILFLTLLIQSSFAVGQKRPWQALEKR